MFSLNRARALFRIIPERIRLAQTALTWVTSVAEQGQSVKLDVLFLRHVFVMHKQTRTLSFSLASDVVPDFVVQVPRRDDQPEGNNWVSLYSSPMIAVWEKTNTDMQLPPIRWGLSDSERRELMRIARETIRRLVAQGEVATAHTLPYALPERFLLPADVDVTVWVHGKVRGSRIVQGLSLGNAVITAAIRAARDSRFRPLERSEMDELRIEIVVFSPLRIPLTRTEIEADVVYPDKGYVYARDTYSGWYMPNVHQVLKLNTLSLFLSSLIHSKSADSRKLTRPSEVRMFSVINFIETFDHAQTLPLTGPCRAISPTAISDRWQRAADWLLHIQRSDGTMPAIVDISGMVVRDMDWTRLACTGHALAEFGTACGSHSYRAAATRIFSYYQNLDFAKHTSHSSAYALMLAYLVKLAHALGESAALDTLSVRLMMAAAKQNGSAPLADAHCAGALLMSKTDDHVQKGQTLRDALADAFRKPHEWNPVIWAEAAALFFSSDKVLARAVMDKIASSHLPKEGDEFCPLAYTRGAGKILEVLVLDKKRYAPEIEHLITWLHSMQYTKENSYCIPIQKRELAEGAFRHDFSNSDMWIDSAAHVLMAYARLIEKEVVSR